jgi:TolA-binding protein
MMNRYIVIPILAMVIAVASCNQANKSAEPTIAQLEKELFDEEVIFTEEGKQKALKLSQLYITYADENPLDTLSATYLFKAADITMNMGSAAKAIELYNRVIYSYPDFRKAPECLFLVAYIYENNFANYGKAKELYEQFIQLYPENEFADDASISIENMGKSPEELIKEFEAKNKEGGEE